MFSVNYICYIMYMSKCKYNMYNTCTVHGVEA